MFILYALVIGLVLGLLTEGRPAGLAALRFRWSGWRCDRRAERAPSSGADRSREGSPIAT